MKQFILILIVLALMLAITIVYQTPDMAAGEIVLEYENTAQEEEQIEDNEVEYADDIEYYKALIKIACDVNGVENVDMAIAISILETGWWKEIDKHWNFGGLTGANGKVYKYSRESEGVDAYAKLLRWYQDKGMDTPEKMAKTYCPANENWSALVTKIMEEI